VCEVPGCSAPSGFVDPGRRTLSRLLWATPPGACAQLVSRGASLPGAALPAACRLRGGLYGGSGQTRQWMSGRMIPWRGVIPEKSFIFRKKNRCVLMDMLILLFYSWQYFPVRVHAINVDTIWTLAVSSKICRQ